MKGDYLFKIKNMYAIVDILGQQFKVEKDQSLFVHRLKGEVGSMLEFENVLLLENDGKVNVGDPYIAGTKVTAKIMTHLKGDKVIVFKKKRRKGYQKSNGHRQMLTKIQIESIGEKAAKTKKAKAEVKVETETTVE